MSWSTLHRVVAKVRSYTWRTKRRLKFAAPALATNSGFPIGYPPFASSTLTILRHGLPLSFLWVSHCTSAPDDLEQNLAHYLFLLIKLYWYLAMPLWIYVVYGLIGYSGRVDDRDQKYCQSWGSSHCGSSVVNLTSIHEDSGSVPGLAQWVTDPVLL